jgi:hypothetical protein
MRAREVGTMFWTLFLGAVKLTLLGMAVLYAVHVLITLRTEGSHYQLKLDFGDPAHSAERLLVWLGVRTLAAILAGFKACLDVLEDTSADVGEWVLHRRNS